MRVGGAASSHGDAASGPTDDEAHDDGTSDKTNAKSKRPLANAQPHKHTSSIFFGCGMTCKMCDTLCTAESPTAAYDLEQYEGIVPWRSYTTLSQEEQPDGSLACVKKPCGKLCRLCDTVYLDMNMQDVHGAIGAHCKKPRGDKVRRVFMPARKVTID